MLISVLTHWSVLEKIYILLIKQFILMDWYLCVKDKFTMVFQVEGLCEGWRISLLLCSRLKVCVKYEDKFTFVFQVEGLCEGWG